MLNRTFVLALALAVRRRRRARAGAAATGRAPSRERQTAHRRRRKCRGVFLTGRKQLIYQTNPGAPGTCDQIFTMNVDGSNKRQLSKGGRTTCGYFFPDGKSIVYASTHLGSAECPPRPSYARGYVWPIYDTYDIFRASPDGSNPRRLTATPGYDAEATIGPDGRIVFTSVRDGDMEIYSMNADGSDVRRLTNRPGPDGGPWFSPDGKQIVFRGRPISDAKELADYQGLLKDESLASHDARNLRDEPRRQQSASGHEARRRQLRAGMASRREADHLCVERQRPEGSRLRHFHDQPRRIRPRADHVQRDVRRFPDVLAGRQEARVRLEPERESPRGRRTCSSRTGSSSSYRRFRRLQEITSSLRSSSLRIPMLTGLPAAPPRRSAPRWAG